VTTRTTTTTITTTTTTPIRYFAFTVHAGRRWIFIPIFKLCGKTQLSSE
jgi:hypothetical protein